MSYLKSKSMYNCMVSKTQSRLLVKVSSSPSPKQKNVLHALPKKRTKPLGLVLFSISPIFLGFYIWKIIVGFDVVLFDISLYTPPYVIQNV